MASGRSMWPPLTVDANAGPLPDPSVVCGEGIVVVAADSQSLVAARARDDAAPLWRRTWARNALGLLRIVDDTVVAVDQEATRVFVLDLSNGRLRGEYALVNSAPDLTVEQIDRSDKDAHAAIVDRIVVRSHGTRVIGLDVRTGKPAWNTIEFNGIVKGLFAFSGGCFGVAHGPNKFSLIRAESGEPVCKTLSADGLAMPPIDVVLDRKPGSVGIDDGQLLFFTRTDESPTELVLESFPLDGVTPSWRKRLGQLATISRQMMRASSEFVAVVQNGVPPARPAA
ncbi:MAG: PQQ-binding-like beta-propeller repeat protein [Planctomycetes bacterium]|nr:PQQ-binding-like beta-propeller repeat protein [Planctomycetota bacterium]